ncbi:energy transducer TonB [Flavobacterium branchiicola]|uniref:Energy transducer TonB n=1 Tax=Flavobacterium branchiicola TaxID=1114875 RepID=A0ABV9P7G4_9FLAO|nr:energy transducer TonB [Flavobacterium branchiicola]MBS7252801.1 energy transducer TonB [Flavobacterium branchiicola]
MKYKITIPEPCHESWDKMTAKDNGRFCLSCSKTVIDFTAMLPEEIQHYFIQNKDEKICGKFRKSQLDSITIQIPDRILYSQTNYHKMFLLALFIAMGTTLFSCQDKDGNKQKIDKIEVVEDSGTRKNNLIDSTSNHKKEIVDKPKSNPNKQAKYSLNKTKKDLFLDKTQCTTETVTREIYEDNTVYGVAGIDVLPDYPGGIEVFYNLFRNDYKIPKELKKSTGEIKMSFVIEKNGTLNEIKTLESPGYETGEEASRILQKSIKWTPGEISGRKVRTNYDLFIKLDLDTLNSKKRKRKFSKITSVKVIKTKDDYENNKTL